MIPRCLVWGTGCWFCHLLDAEDLGKNKFSSGGREYIGKKNSVLNMEAWDTCETDKWRGQAGMAGEERSGIEK